MTESAKRLSYSTESGPIRNIVNMYQKGHLKLSPGFQRNSVWKLKNRQALIRSILANYPLPSIFLYKREIPGGSSIFEVIDGKQRIESIFLFMGVLRGEDRGFSITDDERKEISWSRMRKGKLGAGLTVSAIEDYKLQVIEVSGDLSDIIDLFVKINSTGKALTTTEKQNAKYYNSPFMKAAASLAKKFTNYFLDQKILSKSQVSRMKHIELACELMVAAHFGEVGNKKRAVEAAMNSKEITGRSLLRATNITQRSLNRMKLMFPDLYTTRFKNLSDFYTLAVLIQKFELEKRVLTDRTRNKLAWQVLKKFSSGVDILRDGLKRGKATLPGEEVYRDYLMTVKEGTDEKNHRQRREAILRELLASIFEKKDSDRLFNSEQRRILWNSVESPQCEECGVQLTWENYTVDHIKPHSIGGKTVLENAALLCRRHNSAKGNRMKIRT